MKAFVGESESWFSCSGGTGSAINPSNKVSAIVGKEKKTTTYIVNLSFVWGFFPIFEGSAQTNFLERSIICCQQWRKQSDQACVCSATTPFHWSVHSDGWDIVKSSFQMKDLPVSTLSSISKTASKIYVSWPFALYIYKKKQPVSILFCTPPLITFTSFHVHPLSFVCSDLFCHSQACSHVHLCANSNSDSLFTLKGEKRRVGKMHYSEHPNQAQKRGWSFRHPGLIIMRELEGRRSGGVKSRGCSSVKVLSPPPVASLFP